MRWLIVAVMAAFSFAFLRATIGFYFHSGSTTRPNELQVAEQS